MMSRTQVFVVVTEALSKEESRSHNVRVDCEVYSKSRGKLSPTPILRSLPVLPQLLNQEVSWAIQGYVKDPFQSHRAEVAFKNFTEHGKFLGKKLNLVGCLETSGVQNLAEVDVQLNIVDTVAINAEGHRVSNPLQSIPWEILESPGITPNGPTIRVRRVSAGAPTGENRTMEKLNVLLITSRSSDTPDIPHRVVSLPLFSILRQLDNRFVNVQLLRPGTFDALSRALEVGNYDMVHFDLHGKVADLGQGKHAYLYFDGNPVEGAAVATLLKKWKVRLVTLNACQSAFLQGDVQTNLATMLLGGSVEAVVAMSHEITPAAVGIFLRSFYQSLLVDGQDMAMAVTRARRSLEASKERDSAFGFPVCLDDYTVPLLYQASANKIQVRLPQRAVIKSGSSTISVISTEPSVLGRDQQILLLERYLILKKVLVLRAFEGEGRATLLAHLKSWWILTNFVQGILSIDFRTSPSRLAGDLELPTAETICRGLVEFRFDVDGKPAPETKLTMDFLQNHRYLVMLENTDYIKPRPTTESDLGKALKVFTSTFYDRDFASFLLITSTSAERWASSPPKPGFHSLAIDSFERMNVATRILGWSGHEVRGSSQFRYLHHIIQLCSYHPLSLRTLLPPLFATGSSARDLYWKLQTAPMHLDWNSESLYNLGRRFGGACKELGGFLNIFMPIHSSCSTDYIRLHIHRNLDTIPWLPGPELQPEERVDRAMQHLLTTLRDYGIAPFVSPTLAEKVELHPLFCIYLRDHAGSPSDLQISFGNLAVYHHNCARRWAQSEVSPLKAPDSYAHHYLVRFGVMHFILQHPEQSESDRRMFDLPWVMASVYCGRTRGALWEEEEIVTDLAQQALPFFVPGLKWVDNRGCNLLNFALLHSRSRVMPFEDCLPLLLFLQWLTLHYFSLSTATARHANSYINLILENQARLGEADNRVALFRFIRAVEGLTEAEIGASSLSWAQADYGVVYNALQHTDELGLDTVRLLFLQTWDQDLRFRLNWYQLDFQKAKENISKWQHAGYFVQSALDERLDALEDESAYMNAIKHLQDGNSNLYQDERSTLIGKMRTSSARGEVARLLHTLYCLLRMSEEEKDWNACLEFLDRIEGTELDTRNKPGYVEDNREKYTSEAWLCRMRARCYRKLGDNDKYEQYKRRSVAAAGHARRLKSGFQSYQQTNRQRLLYQWNLDLPQDGSAKVNDFYTRPNMNDVPIPQEELEEEFEYDRQLEVLVRGAQRLGGPGEMRRMPVNPQPLDLAYLQRPFLVAARWLTVSRYLCLVTGKEESQPQGLPEFERKGTRMDLMLLLESTLVQDLESGSHGFQPGNLTTEQFLGITGLD